MKAINIYEQNMTVIRLSYFCVEIKIKNVDKEKKNRYNKHKPK